MLLWKFKLGLFEDPYVDPDVAERIVGCEAHRRTGAPGCAGNDYAAEERRRHCAAGSANHQNASPSSVPTPTGNCWVATAASPNTARPFWKAFATAPDRINVLYHEGCKITIGGSWQQDEVVPSDPAEDRKSIAEAVKVAQQADVVVLAIGGNEQTSREAWMLNHLGDRASLDMVGRQDELVDAIAATGKPIIAFLFNGRPISIRNLTEKAQAIFECWYLGQETGQAVAEVLFGDVNPGGKLPITIPRSVGHLPAYYNYKPAARRGYLFDDVSPLYRFRLRPELYHIQIRRTAADKKRSFAKTNPPPYRVDVTNSGQVQGMKSFRCTSATRSAQSRGR